jgi:hypothetical protein
MITHYNNIQEARDALEISMQIAHFQIIMCVKNGGFIYIIYLLFQ